MRFVIASTALAATICLSGCSYSPRETRAAYESASDAGPASSPMAGLPGGAGDVVTVLQSKSDGMLEQKIVLRGDIATGGENFIRVTVDQHPSSPGIPDGRSPKPSEAIIAQELEDNFPGTDMRLSQSWQRNDFGPFGYAIGHAYGGVVCVYAWQYSPGQAPALIVDLGADGTKASMPVNPTSVRARLCKSGMDDTAMVELLRHLDVYPPGSAQAYVNTTSGPTLTSWNALASADNPHAAYLSHDKSAEASSSPNKKRRRHHHRHRRSHEDNAGFGALAPVGVMTGITVPIPGAPQSPAALDSANPLLAPLKTAMKKEPKAASDSVMPLPAPAAAQNAPKPAAAAPAPSVAPLPLPN